MKIKFSPTAESDLDVIRSYIAQNSSVAAERVVARILQSIMYLQDFPRLGRPGFVSDTRELSILGLPYKAVYRIEGDSILIVTIIHHRRMYP